MSKTQTTPAPAGPSDGLKKREYVGYALGDTAPGADSLKVLDPYFGWSRTPDGDAWAK